MRTDSVSQIDLLEREPFAKSIADGIVKATINENDGFVVGLTGKWGSGKSTLLDFVKKELLQQCEVNKINYSLIEFNPWQFTDEENIKKTFLNTFQRHLKQKKNIKFYAKKYKWTLGFLKFLGNTGTGIEVLLKKYIESESSLEIKKEINKTLVKTNIKIFVFIDDIDRLYPKQVFEILQVLKLTGGFQNTYYIISFDREAVEISIESQFKDYGKKYLDKIIQADFLIPEIPTEKIEDIFFSSLNQMCKDYSLNYNSSEFSSIWLHKGLKYYFTTLREVYRYFNSIQFRLPSIHDDISITDFLILEAIRLYDFEAYEFIYKTYNAKIIDLTLPTNFTSSKEIKGVKNEHSRKLIQYLFPDTVELSNNQINNKRLCNPRYFDRFFTLKINTKDIAENDLKLILENNEDRITKLQNISKFGRLKNLLLRLNDNKLLNYYTQWNYSLIEDLFNFIDNDDLGREENTSLITDSIINLLSLNQKRDSQSFKKFIVLLITDNRKLSLARILFLHFMVLDKEHETGFFRSSPEFQEGCKNKYNEIKDFYLKYISDWRSSFIYKIPTNKPTYITKLFVYDYSKHYNSDYVELFPSLLKDESNLMFLLQCVLSIDSIRNEAFSISTESLNQYIPNKHFRDFYATISEMSTINLDLKQKQWRDFFLSTKKEELQALYIPLIQKYTLKSQPTLPNDPNYNDHICETIYSLNENPINITITPNGSPFWRVGFFLTHEKIIRQRESGRHNNKASFDIDICIGQPVNKEGSLIWGYSNKIEISEYNFSNIEDSLPVYSLYKGDPLRVSLVQDEKGSSIYTLQLILNNSHIGYRKYDLENIKYLSLAAWCDQHEFELELEVSTI